MSAEDTLFSRPPREDPDERPPLWVRAFQAMANKVGVWNLAVLVLLVAVLGSVANGIASVVRGVDFRLLWLTGIIAMFVGWFLERTRLRAWTAALVSTVLGLIAVMFRVGRLDQLGWAILQHLSVYLGQGARWLWSEIAWRSPSWLGLTPVGASAPEPASLLAALEAFWGAVTTLASRSGAWLGGLFSGAPAYDPVAATLVWGLLFWLASVWAGWVVRRRNPLVSVMPVGLLLTTALSYAWGETISLVFLLGWSLMLMAVVGHYARERRWEAEKIDFSRDIRFELLGVAVLISVGLMSLSAVAPSIEVDEIVDYIRDLTEKEDEGAPGTGDAVAESLGLEQQPRPQKPNDLDKARVGGLPRRHLLGTGPELSRRVVMLIRTNEYAPMPQLPPGEEAPRYYWRGATYDNYTGRGWNTTSYSTVEYEPGGRSHVSELPFHRSIRQEVEVIGATGNLAHVAGQLVATDRAYKVAWRSSGDAFAATLVAKTYRADSLVAMATEDQLREARINYPPWILDRYMDLPETVPERVLALARDLTATAPTAYDRAVAIETYLRENFPYTLDVEPPPIHRDVADFFLFTTQEGYCDYYATAMVVLARAAGLPARLTVGYATGTYDPLEAAYIVTEADAHAWVEIYFPGYGWITFEPTGGRPPLDRSSDEEPLMWPDQPRESLRPAPVVRGPLARYWYLFIVGVAAAVLLLYLLGMQFDLLLLRLRPPAVVVTQLYHRLRRQAMKMGARLAPGDTPHEFSMILSQRIEVVSRRRLRENWVLPAAIEEAQRICETYVGVWYREDAPGSKERNARLRDWRRLRWRLLLVRFWSRPRSRLARLFAPARFGEAEVPGRAAQPSPMDQRY